VGQVAVDFQKSLVVVSLEIARRNKDRESQPGQKQFVCMDPKILESSVSI